MAERIRLAQAIWDSIAEVPQATELTEEQKFKLDQRLAELEKSPSLGLSWDQVIKDLRR